MPLVFVESTRGKPLLELGGYLFRRDYVAQEKTKWRCIEKNCRARVETQNDEHSVSTSAMASSMKLSVEVLLFE